MHANKSYSSHISQTLFYTLKTSGLKYPAHLKMTQFGSNVLHLARLGVTLGSILEENV